MQIQKYSQMFEGTIHYLNDNILAAEIIKEVTALKDTDAITREQELCKSKMG